MITVLLNGRTGNNLFQYAVGRALASRCGTNLVLDASWLHPRNVGPGREIMRFPLRAEFHCRHVWLKWAGRKFMRNLPAIWFHRPYYTEPNATFDKRVLELGPDAVLNGFFQYPAYFSGYEEEIRRDLDCERLQLGDAFRVFRDRLRAGTFAALHVRRGDYLQTPSTHCLTPDYYDRAITHLRERHPGLKFCVFSDDIGWCRMRFQGADFIFADWPEARMDPLHDLALMAACSHQIIANSTYSWWGAWLNPKPNKIVIAPVWWMRGLSSEGIVPGPWIRL